MRSDTVSTFCASWTTAVIALSLSSALAQVPDKPAGYVTDSARVMSDRDIKLLNARCAGFDQTHRAQIAIVTVASLKGEPIEKTALNLFRKWGVGRKDINDGLLLMLAVEDRKSRITVGYGLAAIVTDAAAASILHAIEPDLRAGRYASAMELALDLFGKLLPIEAR